MNTEAFVRATMIVTGAIMATAVVLMLLLALLPAQVQTQVRGRILRGTNQLFKILDGTANAFAVVVVIWMLGTLVGPFSWSRR